VHVHRGCRRSWRAQPGDVGHDLGGRPESARRVVLLGSGRPEYRHDGVADELLHVAAVLPHSGGADLVIPVEQQLERLRVHALGERGVADNVQEEDHH
jgi:hypothetical protein